MWPADSESGSTRPPIPSAPLARSARSMAIEPLHAQEIVRYLCVFGSPGREPALHPKAGLLNYGIAGAFDSPDATNGADASVTHYSHNARAGCGLRAIYRVPNAAPHSQDKEASMRITVRPEGAGSGLGRGPMPKYHGQQPAHARIFELGEPA